jgi:tape measure domain-containing protein
MAELKLRVSLDTSYLKGQISRLPLEFAGANVSIRPKFDKQTIVNEFRLLNRYISSKKFNIVINTNLEAEIKNADRLIKALGRVQQAAGGAKGGLPIGTQVLSRTKAKGGFAAAEIKALFGAAVQGGLIDDKTLAATRAQMVAALGEIGKDSIAGLLNGLKSGDADIRAAAQMLGNNLITSFKTVLGIASPSKEFKKLGEAAGQGFEQGLLKSIEIAEQSAARKMQRMLDRLARMVLMMGGMSGPEIGRQIAQARALPSLNFGATTPRTSFAIGPSSTGRALPPGIDRLGLPGTSFASQKLLSGDLLTPSMKAAIRDAANEFVDNLRGSLNNAIREVNVRDLGRMGAPMLGGVRTTGFLPAGVGRPSNPYGTGRLGREGETRAELFARREREARMRSALRGVDIMGEGGMAGRSASPYSYAYRGARPQSSIVPYERGGAMVYSGLGGGGGAVPPTPPRGGGGGGSFGGMQFNVPQLPGAGLVREIGEEFGFAAKQVLLFGTAYKTLAFIQGFPAQVGEAVGALQSFRNTIGEISPSAQEAAESSQFILDIVEKYNTPLQSARDGFVKLYASMQPAGFSGDEIRDLFLGISQTAATFGMSADKVDRVNYAFAQMASKGQVMSEELKGQLGDVLPGAMAIFAEAAGFKGPEAITKFSKALEDGTYKGGAMKVLLTNVGSIMRQEFGPGAEGAARTFQGVMNRMQNSAKLLYEAFEPVAVGFLNSVVMPLTSGLKTVTDGFNAFFTGVNAKTAGGFAFAQELEKLRPTFEGIRANVTALLPTLQSFANTLLNVSKVFLQIVGNPFVGYLARVYLNVLALTTAINILNLRALIPMIANFARSLYALVAFAVQCVSTGSVVQRLGMAVQVTGLMLRTFFATTGIGLVLVGIGLLTERFMTMNQALADTKAKALGASDAIRAMSQTEARQASQQYDRQAQSLKGLSKEIEDGKMKGKAWIEVTKEQAEALKSAGITVSNVRGSLQVQPMRVGGAFQKVEGLAAEAKYKVRELGFQDKQAEQQANIAPITAGGGDGAAAAASKLDTYNRSTLEFIKQQGELEQQSLDRKRQQNLLSETQYKIDSASLALEVAKKEEAEKLRVATLATNKDNLSSGDKALKIADLQTAYQNNLAIAQDKYTTAVDGARKELSGPFDSAIKDTNASMVEQRMLLGNLQNGIEGLTPDQQAYLKVVEMTRDLSQDETDILKDKINLLRGAIEQQVLLNQEVEQGKILNELGGQLRLAQTLDPRAELRETLRQRNPLFSEVKIEEQAVLSEQVAAAQKAKDDLKGIASTIGDAFGEAFKGIITGTATVREALGGLFQSIADSFADMVAQMIAEWLKAQLIKGFLSLFPGFNGGGLSNLSAPASIGNPLGDLTGVGAAYANGGIAAGGFTAFANGGIVTGPTLGLVGEGRYNEAVIPLPDGKSVPVDLGGAAGSQINSNITVNVNNGQAQSNATGSNSSELGRKIEGAVKQVIVGELRPGGLLASR